MSTEGGGQRASAVPWELPSAPPVLSGEGWDKFTGAGPRQLRSASGAWKNRGQWLPISERKLEPLPCPTRPHLRDSQLWPHIRGIWGAFQELLMPGPPQQKIWANGSSLDLPGRTTAPGEAGASPPATLPMAVRILCPWGTTGLTPNLSEKPLTLCHHIP